MSDQNKSQSQTSDDKKAGDKPFLEGTYHGQKVAWDEDAARSLAQKGLDYESKMSAVKAEKDAIASNKDEYAKFQQWRQALASDPRRAQAVAQAFQDPDSFVRHTEGDGGDKESTPVQRQGPPQVPAEVHELKSQIEQLQGSLKGLTDANAADTQKLRLERAVGSHSFLSSDEEKALAVETSESLMVRNPDMTPEGAMAVTAEKLKGILQGQNQTKLDRKDTANDMKTVDPSTGTPQGASERDKPKPDYTKRRQSTLRGDVMKELMNGTFKDRFTNF